MPGLGLEPAALISGGLSALPVRAVLYVDAHSLPGHCSFELVQQRFKKFGCQIFAFRGSKHWGTHSDGEKLKHPSCSGQALTAINTLRDDPQAPAGDSRFMIFPVAIGGNPSNLPNLSCRAGNQHAF